MMKTVFIFIRVIMRHIYYAFYVLYRFLCHNSYYHSSINTSSIEYVCGIISLMICLPVSLIIESFKFSDSTKIIRYLLYAASYLGLKYLLKRYYGSTYMNIEKRYARDKFVTKVIYALCAFVAFMCAGVGTIIMLSN